MMAGRRSSTDRHPRTGSHVCARLRWQVHPVSSGPTIVSARMRRYDNAAAITKLRAHQAASAPQRMNSANRMITGRGIPSSHSKAPRPKVIVSSILRHALRVCGRVPRMMSEQLWSRPRFATGHETSHELGGRTNALAPNGSQRGACARPRPASGSRCGHDRRRYRRAVDCLRAQLGTTRTCGAACLMRVVSQVRCLSLRS